MLQGSAEAARQVGQRVAGYAVEAGLEVQMVAGGGAGGADPPDDLAAAYVLADVHEHRRLVAVAGGEADSADLPVVDAGVAAVATGPARPDHPPVGRGVDRCAAAGREVRPGMQLPHTVVRVVSLSVVTGFPAVDRHVEPAALVPSLPRLDRVAAQRLLDARFLGL